MTNKETFLSRRSALLLGAFTIFGGWNYASADAMPLVTVNKNPSCGCCAGWAEHLRQAGFPVKTIETSDLQPLKTRLGIPTNLSSCHTAHVSGYVIEGHVPATAILKLLRDKPKATGLAVPGMPIGSPGMEGPNPEIYDVILFGKGRRQSFARFKGKEPVLGGRR